jgi:hypothetical protein
MTADEARTFSAEAMLAFRKMLYHKVAMWDASSDLESAALCEVDTGQLDYLASSFGPADEILHMDDTDLLQTMQDWMSDEDNATFYEEDE